jgi:hypothetical protein
MPADILVLDWDAVDHERVRADLDPLDMLFARSTMRHIDELIVGGRSVVRAGRVLGIDYPAMLDDMLGRLRAGMNERAGLAAAIRELERAIGAHYRGEAPCC